MEKIILLQLNRLGDLVQTVPLLRRLRRQYTDAEITLVCIKGLHLIVKECGYFNRLVAINPDAIEAEFEANSEFRDNYDACINVTSDLGSAILNEKIHSANKFGRVNTFDGELRLLGPWAKYLFAMVSHRLDNLFNIVDIQTGIAGLKPEPENASLPVSTAGHWEAKSLLDSHGRHGGRRLIALQTGASQLHRAWALENFAALAQHLLHAGNIEILLLGDASERERAQSLQSMVPFPILDLVGRTSLSQLPAILAACELLISNDTGTIHIAAAVGTRTLGLFFSTAYFSETAPYGEGHAVLQVEIPCAPCSASARCPVQVCRDYLPVAAVTETVRWILEKRSESPPIWPNLSLYLSHFLENGSFIFLPVHAKASKHYLTGLKGRLLWEGALGLGRDPILNEIWLRNRSLWEKDSSLAEMAGTLDAMADTFSRGQQLSQKLRQEFNLLEPHKAKILMLNRQLAELGTDLSVSCKEGGIFGDFLNYEMMDLDYAIHPQLAVLLEEKYARLLDWANRFRQTLTVLTTS